MNLEPALATLQSLLRQAAWSWPVFAVGMACGLLPGALLTRLPRRRRVARRSRVLHDVFALTPAILACLLWGLWLGILAAKSFTGFR